MIISRSIFKELLNNLLVTTFSLSILLFINKFVTLTRLFMGKTADLGDLAKIFIYIQPSLLIFSLPMAILISIFLTYGRMSTDSEIIVMKGSGMSFWGISKPAALLSVLCCIIMLFTSLYLLPRSMSALKQTIHETIIKKASMTLEEGTFSAVFEDTVIFVKEIKPKDRFRGLFIYKDVDKSLDSPVAIIAEEGSISSDPEKGLIKLSMNNGFIHTYKDSYSTEATFKEYDLVLASGMGQTDKVRSEEIKTSALWKGRKKHVRWHVEFHRRLALPLACIIFGILGAALTNRVGKVGRLGGFLISLSIIILYYMLLVFAEGLAKTGEMAPFLGGWLPDIVFGTVTLFFIYLAQTDKPFKRL